MDLILTQRVFVTRSIIVDDVAVAWILEDWMIAG
jgi:hypothetical protein